MCSYAPYTTGTFPLFVPSCLDWTFGYLVFRRFDVSTFGRFLRL